MRYELIDGDTRIINIMVNHGWEIVNTFQNPNPQPYFFALMRLNDSNGKNYSVENINDHVYRGENLNPWQDTLDL
jgi:hypothetical protein